MLNVARLFEACGGCPAGAQAPNLPNLAKAEQATNAAANAVASLAAITGNRTALTLVSVT